MATPACIRSSESHLFKRAARAVGCLAQAPGCNRQHKKTHLSRALAIVYDWHCHVDTHVSINLQARTARKATAAESIEIVCKLFVCLFITVVYLLGLDSHTQLNSTAYSALHCCAGSKAAGEHLGNSAALWRCLRSTNNTFGNRRSDTDCMAQGRRSTRTLAMRYDEDDAPQRKA